MNNGCNRERFIETVRFYIGFLSLLWRKKKLSQRIKMKNNHFLDEEKLLSREW